MSVLRQKLYTDLIESTTCLDVGENIFAREPRGLGITPTLTSSIGYFSYFTAKVTEMAYYITLYVVTPTSGTAPTLCKATVYRVDSNTRALDNHVTTGNITTQWNTVGASKQQLLDAVGGTPAPFRKVRGERYALGVMCKSTGTLPIFVGCLISNNSTLNTVLGVEPRIIGQVSDTDLASGYSAGSITNGSTPVMIYAEFTPS